MMKMKTMTRILVDRDYGTDFVFSSWLLTSKLDFFLSKFLLIIRNVMQWFSDMLVVNF